MSLYRITQCLKGLNNRITSKILYASAVGSLDRTAMIASPARFNNPKGITVNKGAVINKYSWMYCCNNDSKISIGEYSQIGHFFHCVSFSKVCIEESVLIADRVFISDCTHEYKDISSSIINSGLRGLRDVSIGAGAWIGEGVCIIGASVGKHAVVGANSVVTHDVPDFSVAAGIPAKIISQYNFEKNGWIRVDGEK